MTCDIITVVVSYMRSGSSMMMGCLEAGGIPTYHDHKTEMNTTHGDEKYKPNAGGFFEMSPNQAIAKDFIANAAGKAVKLLRSAALHLPEHDYRVVVLWRHPEESRQSYEAFANDRWPLGEVTYTQYRESWKRLVETLRERPDMDVQTLNMRDVVFRPERELASLGWPIDVKKAAAYVDPKQYRFRMEWLTPGIGSAPGATGPWVEDQLAEAKKWAEDRCLSFTLTDFGFKIGDGGRDRDAATGILGNHCVWCKNFDDDYCPCA